MKIVALIIVLLLGLGVTVKKSCDDKKEISFQNELNQYKSQPNMLPVVEVVHYRS